MLRTARLASGHDRTHAPSSSTSTPGIDDSLALLYAAASPDAELVAATCVSGNVDARQVAINTRAILELAGRTDVEVALGREIPLVRALETTPETHGPQGLGHAELPPPTRAAVRPPRGRRHPRRGARATGRDHPRDARSADEPRHRGPARAGAAPPAQGLHADGRGVRRARATRRPTTEWNIHCDPEAAKIVFRAWAEAREADPADPAAARPRPRRHRAGADPPRRRRPARAPGGQHAGRLARAGPRRGPDAGDPFRGEQPDRPLRRRRAALLHGVPRRRTTASTGRSSTIRWPSPRPSTGAS